MAIKNGIMDHSMIRQTQAILPFIRHQHCIARKSSINLGETLSQITCQWKTTLNQSWQDCLYLFIKYLRQYAHSHWWIGVFRREYATTVATSRFLFPWHISTPLVYLSSTSTNIKKFKRRKLFQVWFGHWPSLPLVEGAQAKTTKYATKYAVNIFEVIFAFNY